jgi:hypothetical protein
MAHYELIRYQRKIPRTIGKSGRFQIIENRRLPYMATSYAPPLPLSSDAVAQREHLSLDTTFMQLFYLVGHGILLRIELLLLAPSILRYMIRMPRGISHSPCLLVDAIVVGLLLMPWIAHSMLDYLSYRTKRRRRLQTSRFIARFSVD